MLNQLSALNPLSLRILVAGVVLVASFGAGWAVNGWRCEARERKTAGEYATALQTAMIEARRREAEMSEEIAAIDAQRTKEVQDAQADNDRLRADVASGVKRLRVRAKCPAGVSAPPAASGVDTDAAAELSGAARQDYHALRAGIAQVTGQLLACQDYVRAVR